MLILKHLFDWSFEDLEDEVRANLVYRTFNRMDAGDVLDAKTILKIARALGPDVIASARLPTARGRRSRRWPTLRSAFHQRRSRFSPRTASSDPAQRRVTGS